jgi:hypothetical protein
MHLGWNEWFFLVAGLVFYVVWFALMVGAAYIGCRLAMRPPKNYRKCGFCSEMISPDAIVCRYCGRSPVGTEAE